MRRVRQVTLTGLLALACAAAWSQAGEPEASPPAARTAVAASEYLRLGRDDAGTPVSLQTSIVRLRPAAGAAPADLVVDLVGAIHIADSRYYEELNEIFSEYDSVLYELVAPEGTRVPLGGVEGGGLLSSLQGGMAGVLGLTFQLDHIDYTRPNLVHSDLSPEDISRSMAERGETAIDYIARLFAMSMSEYARDPMGVRSMGLIAALFSPDRERLLKAQIAPMMLEMEAVTASFEGADGSVLIRERNSRAVSVLEERIVLGERRIAIFFGAAHMSDMAAQIESRLGLRQESTVWVDAWDLR